MQKMERREIEEQWGEKHLSSFSQGGDGNQPAAAFSPFPSFFTSPLVCDPPTNMFSVSHIIFKKAD